MNRWRSWFHETSQGYQTPSFVVVWIEFHTLYLNRSLSVDVMYTPLNFVTPVKSTSPLKWCKLCIIPVYVQCSCSASAGSDIVLNPSYACMSVQKKMYLVLADTVGWNVSYGSTQPLKAVSFWYLVCVCQRCLAAVASVVKIVNITSSVSIYNHHECQFTQFLGN